MKKICIFGCKSTTIFLLESLHDILDISCVITIDSELAEKNQVADYADVAKCCEEKNIVCYHASRYDLNSMQDRDFFNHLNSDIAFVVGWQRIIPEQILETFSIGVFGMHGSTDDLPVGRGRSPMNWALIEQRRHFFTNLFKYNSGIDAGDILDKFVFSIRHDDTAETMHYKNVLAMKKLILNNLNNLLSNNFDLKKQKEINATYYPKRSPKDSLIDWEQDIFQLDSFIRAVTKPFNGAFSYLDNKKVIIWRASIFETNLVNYGYRDESWGTIVEVFLSGKFLINCRGGLMIVHEFETTAHVKKGKILSSPSEDIPEFKLNKFGCHDLKNI